MTLHNHLFLNTIPLPKHHPYTHPELPKQSVAKSETFGSKSLACCNLFPLSVKKMHDVWGILAVFTRMQREKEGEL